MNNWNSPSLNWTRLVKPRWKLTFTLTLFSQPSWDHLWPPFATVVQYPHLFSIYFPDAPHRNSKPLLSFYAGYVDNLLHCLFSDLLRLSRYSKIWQMNLQVIFWSLSHRFRPTLVSIKTCRALRVRRPSQYINALQHFAGSLAPHLSLTNYHFLHMANHHCHCHHCQPRMTNTACNSGAMTLHGQPLPMLPTSHWPLLQLQICHEHWVHIQTFSLHWG